MSDEHKYAPGDTVWVVFMGRPAKRIVRAVTFESGGLLFCSHGIFPTHPSGVFPTERDAIQHCFDLAHNKVAKAKRELANAERRLKSLGKKYGTMANGGVLRGRKDRA